jgi:uncharacterized protein (DUF736 family)
MALLSVRLGDPPLSAPIGVGMTQGDDGEHKLVWLLGPVTHRAKARGLSVWMR